MDLDRDGWMIWSMLRESESLDDVRGGGGESDASRAGGEHMGQIGVFIPFCMAWVKSMDPGRGVSTLGSTEAIMTLKPAVCCR